MVPDFFVDATRFLFRGKYQEIQIINSSPRLYTSFNCCFIVYVLATNQMRRVPHNFVLYVRAAEIPTAAGDYIHQTRLYHVLI